MALVYTYNLKRKCGNIRPFDPNCTNSFVVGDCASTSALCGKKTPPSNLCVSPQLEVQVPGDPGCCAPRKNPDQSQYFPRYFQVNIGSADIDLCDTDCCSKFAGSFVLTWFQAGNIDQGWEYVFYNGEIGDDGFPVSLCDREQDCGGGLFNNATHLCRLIMRCVGGQFHLVASFIGGCYPPCGSFQSEYTAFETYSIPLPNPNQRIDCYYPDGIDFYTGERPPGSARFLCSLGAIKAIALDYSLPIN